MKEKVLSVKLPEGAKYLKVIVAEDSRSVDIVYSEECKCQEQVKEKAIISTGIIPKSDPFYDC